MSTYRVNFYSSLDPRPRKRLLGLSEEFFFTDMNRHTEYQDSPCQLCARLAEENDLLQQQLDLATSVIAHQIENLEELREEIEAANMTHLHYFGFPN